MLYIRNGSERSVLPMKPSTVKAVTGPCVIRLEQQTGSYPNRVPANHATSVERRRKVCCLFVLFTSLQQYFPCASTIIVLNNAEYLIITF